MFDLKVAVTIILSMMFNIGFDHLIRDVAGGADKVADGPEVLAPIAFMELGKFLLDLAGRFTLNILHEFADGDIWWDRNIDMDVIFGHRAPENFGLIILTNLTNEVPDTNGDVAHKYRIPILGDPDNMIGTIKRGVAGFAIVLAHIPRAYHRTC